MSAADCTEHDVVVDGNVVVDAKEFALNAMP